MPGRDTFYVGTLKGVGRVYQQIDTYSKLGFAKLYTRKTPLTAADILNDRVIPFFDEHQIPSRSYIRDRWQGGMSRACCTDLPGMSATHWDCL